MNIEIGDIVNLYENDILKFSWLEVLELHGEEALCRHQISEKDYDGNQRPSITYSESLFPISSMKIVKKK